MRIMTTLQCYQGNSFSTGLHVMYVEDEIMG